MVASTDCDNYAAFDLRASLGALNIEVHFWDYSDLFQSFGSQLAAFPHALGEEVQIEIGKQLVGLSRSYLLLKAYCFDAQGHAALKIVTQNNEAEPQAQRVEFSIPADISSLNKLGTLLKNWSPQGNSEVIWQAHIS